MFQFVGVAYLFIINIDLRLALGQDVEFAIVILLNHWYHRKQIVGCTDIVQDRVLHIDRQSALSRFVLWNLALHFYAFHHIGLGQESNRANVAHADVPLYGLITNKRNLHHHLLSGLAGNHEVAIPVAHSPIDITIAIQ